MNIERNEFLTIELGGCNQDIGTYRDSGYLCCRRCREIITNRNCSNTIDFSTWTNFGKLLEWSKRQGWFPSYLAFSYGLNPRCLDISETWPHIKREMEIKDINPDILADTIYAFLYKWRKNEKL